MNTLNTAPESSKSGFRAGYAVVGTVILFSALCVTGVAGYFRLGSETSALRQSLMGSVNGQWKKTIAIHLGWFTTGLVRAGSQFVKLDPEPRAALEAVRGVEVGVYQLQRGSEREDHGLILARADRAMLRRGWLRVVGVSHDRELVAVYMPRKGMSLRNTKCSVLVFNGRELVVVGASGNLKPLLAVVEKHLETGLNRHALVTCAAAGPGLPIPRD